MTTDDFKQISSSIPREPGVYKFLDASDHILYVGKAKNLRNRLASYFGDKKHLAYKTRTLVKNAHHIDYTILETESDALLLENTLIKKFQPRYNVMLKDGKTYTYLCIKNERFPRVFFTRRVIRDGSVYFGPYTSKYRAKIILDLIRRLFPLRTCSYHLSQENIDKGKFKVCLEYHIRNCVGPCENLESEAAYDRKIQQVKNILRGQFKPVKDFINEQMDVYAAKLEFEKAQQFKDKLAVFEDYQSKSTVVNQTIRDVDVFSISRDETMAYVNYLKVVNGALINTDIVELKMNLNDDVQDLMRFAIRRLRDKFNSIAPEIVVPLAVKLADDAIKVTVPKKGDKRKLLELSEKNVKHYLLQKQKDLLNRKQRQTHAERILKTLRDDLQMEDIPYHIECFDNSNIQGHHPVASCVVFLNAKPAKKEYRRFHIKTVQGANDFASMEEIVWRRYRRLLDEGSNLPQLIIIDGGKGQLNAAVTSLTLLGIRDKVTIIGIAKRLEEIYFPDDPIPLYINKKSESLKLIQQARNEAHRFAINFHRDTRSKSLLQTELTRIPGIGERNAQKILKAFGSVERVRQASQPELEKAVGPMLARKILMHFQISDDPTEAHSDDPKPDVPST